MSPLIILTKRLNGSKRDSLKRPVSVDDCNLRRSARSGKNDCSSKDSENISSCSLNVSEDKNASSPSSAHKRNRRTQLKFLFDGLSQYYGNSTRPKPTRLLTVNYRTKRKVSTQVRAPSRKPRSLILEKKHFVRREKLLRQRRKKFNRRTQAKLLIDGLTNYYRTCGKRKRNSTVEKISKQLVDTAPRIKTEEPRQNGCKILGTISIQNPSPLKPCTKTEVQPSLRIVEYEKCM